MTSLMTGLRRLTSSDFLNGNLGKLARSARPAANANTLAWHRMPHASTRSTDARRPSHITHHSIRGAVQKASQLLSLHWRDKMMNIRKNSAHHQERVHLLERERRSSSQAAASFTQLMYLRVWLGASGLPEAVALCTGGDIG